MKGDLGSRKEKDINLLSTNFTWGSAFLLHKTFGQFYLEKISEALRYCSGSLKLGTMRADLYSSAVSKAMGMGPTNFMTLRCVVRY